MPDLGFDPTNFPQTQDEFDRVNPCIGINKSLNGFLIWTDSHISSCSGQKKYSHQAKRMKKWGDIINKGKC